MSGTKINVFIELIQRITGKRIYKDNGAFERYAIDDRIVRPIHCLDSSLVRDARVCCSHHGSKAVKCSLKANDGFLYPLDDCFFFVNKPPTFLPYKSVRSVDFARLAMATMQATRSFDLNVQTESNMYTFTNIATYVVRRPELGELSFAILPLLIGSIVCAGPSLRDCATF